MSFNIKVEVVLKLIRKFIAIFRWIGLDVLSIGRSILRVPRYIYDIRSFRALDKLSDWPVRYYPVFLDKGSSSAILGEYFWQDLFVAKKVIMLNPNRHIDVGSRIDGFIAHLACIRSVEVFDIRPLNFNIENVVFSQWDMTNPNARYNGVSDCITCLHTLEHIGLGRYGDKLDPNGWGKGLASLAALMAPKASLWISVPIGKQRIEFNAHRIFHPRTIINYATDLGLSLSGFWYYSDNGFIESMNINRDIDILAQKEYSLGVFLFVN